MRALIALFSTLLMLLSSPVLAAECPAYLNHDLRKLHSSDSVNLCEIAGNKPMLVVNTASRCGFTGQFDGLESLHKEYSGKGLVVVGFASDDFRQEADSEAEAASVCFKNYGVTFTMIAPTAVTGSEANPVFQAINSQSTQPRWNFHKYVLNARGEVVETFPSQVKPESPELRGAIERVVADR
ncbi:glutathione peroxidase [Marinobacter confluentis]|uniref:Glutathione peroxidase n=1 Tax=Marinobacter confluentis TaxID=1697557 RepID=A0A4Z1BZY2_9GAMM|nr:glutathione peroxidase [Marinobacter confluentis]TGN39223.1 glutathione peroxidase [Marinobacter confluentis]